MTPFAPLSLHPQSCLEFSLRIQEFIELIRQNKRLDAVRYAVGMAPRTTWALGRAAWGILAGWALSLPVSRQWGETCSQKAMSMPTP